MPGHQAILALAAEMKVSSAVPTEAAEPRPLSWGGREEVKASRVDVGFLLPRADFRGYGKVMLEQPEVAVRRYWMRSMNSGMTHRGTQADATRILETVRRRGDTDA